MSVHPAALVLADHLFRPRFRPGEENVFGGVCTCKEWVGMDYDHPEHLARILADAELLADGPSAETPDRTSARRAGR